MIGAFLAITLVAHPVAYPATVIKVIDGDTIKVHIAGWPAYFDPIDVRIQGIDTPEHIKPPAKKLCEVKMGLASIVVAKTIIQPGQAVVITWDGKNHDKYLRLLGTVTLPNGSDFGALMINRGGARPYDGKTKRPWC